MSADRARVLLVDDDPTIARALGRLLAVRFEVRTCDGATAALEALGQHRVDVMVSDYDMPGHTGAWLLREVARRSPTTGRVLVSSGDVPGIELLLEEGVVHAFVTKSRAVVELSPVLEALLRRRS